MTLDRDLERIGLNEKEAGIYLAALELGNAVVRDIAAKAEVSRPTAYIVLESLVKRGLASAVREGEKTYYAAEHPKQLELLLQKERATLKEREAILFDIVPQLTSLYHSADRHPIVKIYTGPEGQLAMDQDGARNRKRGQTAYSFTALDLLEEFQRDKIDQYPVSRVKFREHLKMIYTHKNGPRSDADDPKALREARFIPKDKYPFEGSIVIRPWFGLRIFSHRNDEFVGITVESRELAKTMQSIFQLCWDLLPEGGITPAPKRSKKRSK